MRHCPKCGTEYEDSAEECMDCHVPLRPGAAPMAPGDEASPQDVKLVPVRTFFGGTSATDAELAKNLLESEGIPCVLIGANAARMYPGLDGRLMVREEDAERAARILKEYAQAAPPNDESA